jgi:hypothetical protein
MWDQGVSATGFGFTVGILKNSFRIIGVCIRTTVDALGKSNAENSVGIANVMTGCPRTTLESDNGPLG